MVLRTWHSTQAFQINLLSLNYEKRRTEKKRLSKVTKNYRVHNKFVLLCIFTWNGGSGAAAATRAWNAPFCSVRQLVDSRSLHAHLHQWPHASTAGFQAIQRREQRRSRGFLPIFAQQNMHICYMIEEQKHLKINIHINLLFLPPLLLCLSISLLKSSMIKNSVSEIYGGDRSMAQIDLNIGRCGWVKRWRDRRAKRPGQRFRFLMIEHNFSRCLLIQIY